MQVVASATPSITPEIDGRCAETDDQDRRQQRVDRLGGDIHEQAGQTKGPDGARQFTAWPVRAARPDTVDGRNRKIGHDAPTISL